ncbi:MAG: DUF1549 domain-containing protein [Verrucomicrobiota bacterium]|nr:DUF1549 domain-containing protein [Verrucomicrobiota bacterium]
MSWHMHAVEWPFVPLTNPPIPQVSASDDSTHPIDAFLLKQLEDEGLTMNPTATPRALVRRAYNDLIGLPPSMETVTNLEMDPSEANWERLIRNLLNRPQYGERWQAIGWILCVLPKQTAMNVTVPNLRPGATGITSSSP